MTINKVTTSSIKLTEGRLEVTADITDIGSLYVNINNYCRLSCSISLYSKKELSTLINLLTELQKELK